MRTPILVTISVLLATLASSTGCEQPDVRDFQTNLGALSSGDEPIPDQFSVDITFCRKIGKKTGKRIGQSLEFAVGEKSYVNGVVDFNQVTCGRTISVHLVWLRPDGHEMFRRYAEVVVQAEQDGLYRSQIRWLNAEDYGYLKEELQEAENPSFTLSSRLNTSRNRERTPGIYTLKVYWNRELLFEKAFELNST